MHMVCVFVLIKVILNFKLKWKGVGVGWGGVGRGGGGLFIWAKPVEAEWSCIYKYHMHICIKKYAIIAWADGLSVLH